MSEIQSNNGISIKAGIGILATLALLSFWFRPAVVIATMMVGVKLQDESGIALLVTIVENSPSILLIASGLTLAFTTISWWFAIVTVKVFDPN